MALHMTQGTDDCALPMAPPRLVALIRHAMPEDGIVCLDNGLYKVGAQFQPHSSDSPKPCLLGIWKFTGACESGGLLRTQLTRSKSGSLIHAMLRCQRKCPGAYTSNAQA